MRGGLSFKKTSTSLLLLCGAALAAAPGWLERVEPVITPAERKVYLSLPVNDRRKFEEDFWAGKGISAQQYFARVEYIDATFGSNRPGSGANTDQGRIYLSLGPPARITRLPSSRTFVPLEIWYYDAVPGVLSTELRLIFFRQNGVGFPQLYSPTTDTIRALLQPQAGTRSMFGPNDSVTESDIRKVLKVGPAEDEVITAAVGVATGIKTAGNDEILGRDQLAAGDAGTAAADRGAVAPDRGAPEARYSADRLGVRRIAGGFPPGDSGARATSKWKWGRARLPFTGTGCAWDSRAPSRWTTHTGWISCRGRIACCSPWMGRRFRTR